MRSRASSEAVGNRSLNRFYLTGGMLSSIVAARGQSIDSMSSFFGLPMSSITLSSWFKVEVPGKTGLPSSSSAKMHPMLHMSTPFVYLLEPKRISGALYHLVAT